MNYTTNGKNFSRSWPNSPNFGSRSFNQVCHPSEYHKINKFLGMREGGVVVCSDTCLNSASWTGLGHVKNESGNPRINALAQ